MNNLEELAVLQTAFHRALRGFRLDLSDMAGISERLGKNSKDLSDLASVALRLAENVSTLTILIDRITDTATVSTLGFGAAISMQDESEGMNERD